MNNIISVCAVAYDYTNTDLYETRQYLSTIQDGLIMTQSF